MHLAAYLPEAIERGARERRDWHSNIVTTDGGYEVRRQRWSEPLRTWDVSFPLSERDGATYSAVLLLFEQALGSTHSFNFRAWTDSGATVRKVRFDGPIEIEGVTPDLDHIASVTLVEVRE